MGSRPPENGAQPAEAQGEQGPAQERARRESGRTRQRRQRQAEVEKTELYRLKVEGAQALGLWERVQADGWGGLSAAESGRVGGYVTRALRMARREAADGGAG